MRVYVSQKERKVKRTVMEIQIIWMQVTIETKSDRKEEKVMMKRREVCVSISS